jgi:hypothetical protein
VVPDDLIAWLAKNKASLRIMPDGIVRGFCVKLQKRVGEKEVILTKGILGEAIYHGHGDTLLGRHLQEMMLEMEAVKWPS